MKANKLIILFLALIFGSHSQLNHKSQRMPASTSEAEFVTEVIVAEKKPELPALEKTACQPKTAGEGLIESVDKLVNASQKIAKKTIKNKKDNSNTIKYMARATHLNPIDMQIQMQTDMQGQIMKMMEIQNQMMQTMMQMQQAIMLSQMPSFNQDFSSNKLLPQTPANAPATLPSVLENKIGFNPDSNQNSPWSNYSNPYSVMPELERQQISQESISANISNGPFNQRSFNF